MRQPDGGGATEAGTGGEVGKGTGGVLLRCRVTERVFTLGWGEERDCADMGNVFRCDVAVTPAVCTTLYVECTKWRQRRRQFLGENSTMIVANKTAVLTRRQWGRCARAFNSYPEGITRMGRVDSTTCQAPYTNYSMMIRYSCLGSDTVLLATVSSQQFDAYYEHNGCTRLTVRKLQVHYP